MTTKEDTNASSTTNVKLGGGKKHRKGRKHFKCSEEMLLNPTPTEELTSHPFSTIEAIDDERGEEAINVIPEVEWVARIDMERKVVEILKEHLNEVDGKFKTHKSFTLKENDNIHNELKGRQHANFKMNENITSLECQLMNVLSTIETMRAKMKASRRSWKLEDHRCSTKRRRPRSRLPRHLCSKAFAMFKMWRTSYEA